jgi:hypothetical protein
MRSLRLLSTAAFLFTAALTARSAWALPCCSACADFPPVCAHGCTPDCVDEAPPVTGLVYDEIAGLCYVVSE